MMTTTSQTFQKKWLRAWAISLVAHLLLPLVALHAQLAHWIRMHPEYLLFLPLPFMVAAKIRFWRARKKCRAIYQETLPLEEPWQKVWRAAKTIGKKRFPRRDSVAKMTKLGDFCGLM